MARLAALAAVLRIGLEVDAGGVAVGRGGVGARARAIDAGQIALTRVLARSAVLLVVLHVGADGATQLLTDRAPVPAGAVDTGGVRPAALATPPAVASIRLRVDAHAAALDRALLARLRFLLAALLGERFRGGSAQGHRECGSDQEARHTASRATAPREPPRELIEPRLIHRAPRRDQMRGKPGPVRTRSRQHAKPGSHDSPLTAQTLKHDLRPVRAPRSASRRRRPVSSASARTVTRPWSFPLRGVDGAFRFPALSRDTDKQLRIAPFAAAALRVVGTELEAGPNAAWRLALAADAHQSIAAGREVRIARRDGAGFTIAMADTHSVPRREVAAVDLAALVLLNLLTFIQAAELADGVAAAPRTALMLSARADGEAYRWPLLIEGAAQTARTFRPAHTDAAALVRVLACRAVWMAANGIRRWA